MNLTPLTPELAQAGKLWFLRRFVHNTGAHNFTLRLSGLEEMSKVDKANLWRDKQRYPMYDFEFVVTDDYLIVKANTSPAAWAEGALWFDGEEWHYKTGRPRITVEWGEKGALLTLS